MRRDNTVGLVLYAILIAVTVAVIFIPTEQPPVPTPVPAVSRDSMYEALIDELLEGWGRCEMSKPGHIVYPSDTAVKII